MTVLEEIDRSSVFGQKLEDLVVSKGSVTLGQAGYRDKLAGGTSFRYFFPFFKCKQTARIIQER